MKTPVEALAIRYPQLADWPERFLELNEALTHARSIRDPEMSRGLGDVYKRQLYIFVHLLHMFLYMLFVFFV